jgi:hypothetical protein
MAGLDSILEAKGKEAIFLPFLGDILLPNSDADKIYKERRKLFKEVTSIDRKFLELMQDNSTISSLEKSKLFNSEDIKMMTQEFEKHQNEIINRKDELVNKIIENLDRSKK